MEARVTRNTCASCDAKLEFPSWHCEACVREQRVCQMCDTSIAEKQKSAKTCSDACRVAKSDGQKQRRKSVSLHSYTLPVEAIEQVVGEVVTFVVREEINAVAADILEAVASTIVDPIIEKLESLQGSQGQATQNSAFALTESEYQTDYQQRMLAALERIEKKLDARPAVTPHNYAPLPPQVTTPAILADDEPEFEVTASQARPAIHPGEVLRNKMMALVQTTQATAAVRTAPNGDGPRKIAGSDTVFDAPEFEDVEVDIIEAK